jgi:hypothetical protein
MIKRVCLLLLALLVLAGCGAKPAAKTGSVEIFSPWVRVSNTGGSTAAYMLIKNGAGQMDKLVNAEFAGAGMVEVMNTTIVDDKMSMQTIPSIDIPANGEVELKPGGYHVMLMNLNQDLKEGETASVTLIFEQGGRVTVDMPIKLTP